MAQVSSRNTTTAQRTEGLTEWRKRLRALGAELTVTEQRERQRLAVDLHDELASPPPLSDSGLPMALQWLAEQMQQHNLLVSCQVKTEIPKIPEDQALLLFQSSRELLFNCVKHAPHEATITLEQVDGSVCIQISDQGAGFDLADARTF
jgi:signal transduction histidine kinase